MGFFSRTNDAASVAIERLKAEIQRNPKDAKLVLELAAAYRAKNAVSDAVGCYLRAANLNQQAGLSKQAVALARQALQLAPKQLEPNLFMADYYEREGLKEDQRGVLKTLAELYKTAGRNQDVEKVLAKIEALGPGR